MKKIRKNKRKENKGNLFFEIEDKFLKKNIKLEKKFIKNKSGKISNVFNEQTRV